jgi:prepilin-type N-terminal cleavage/methylation domain-containing protein
MKQENHIFTRSSHQEARRMRHSAFTLIEVMVALTIFAIMMAIIFVPLNMGLNLFHIGKTRAELLQAAQDTLDKMERELRKAVYVFPNEALPGVTDRAPYQINDVDSGGQPINPEGKPYVRVSGSGMGVCNVQSRAQAEYVNNPSRLDFLLPNNFYSGSEQLQPVLPLSAGPYLVSYYYRRLAMQRDMNEDGDLLDPEDQIGPDPFDNPIVLFRAQMPYREHNGSTVLDSGNRNVNLLPANIGNTQPARYQKPSDPLFSTFCGGSALSTNRGSYWLNQLAPMNEPNLEPLCKDSNAFSGGSLSPDVPGSHTVMLPRGVSLVARNAYGAASPPDFTPDTTFRCADTDGDHKIDVVTINLAVSSYDENGADRSNGRGNDRPTSAAANDQRVRLSLSVSLPNAK